MTPSKALQTHIHNMHGARNKSLRTQSQPGVVLALNGLNSMTRMHGKKLIHQQH